MRGIVDAYTRVYRHLSDEELARLQVRLRAILLPMLAGHARLSDRPATPARDDDTDEETFDPLFGLGKI